MGYRHYFYRVGKQEVNDIKNMSKDELLEHFKAFPEVVEEDEGDTYINFHQLLKTIGANEVFEFGKYYENEENIMKLSEPMFDLPETQKEFEYYHPVVVGKEAVECAVEFNRHKVVEYFEGLLQTPEEARQKDPIWYDSRTIEEKIKYAIEQKIRIWKYRPFSLEGRNMVTSWMYEYEVFQLVDLYRNTDWEKYCLIFFGY